MQEMEETQHGELKAEIPACQCLTFRFKACEHPRWRLPGACSQAWNYGSVHICLTLEAT